jgi:DNA-binding transcriptional LysR family regulator
VPGVITVLLYRTLGRSPNTLILALPCLSGIVRGVELRHLRYFLAVAESQNFTRASQRLRVAQPALGRQVTDLEEELGVRLLAQSPRGAVLTAAGTAFAVEARAVLARAGEAVRVARAFATGERGELHLGYAPSPTVELLPRILDAFQSEAPGIRVSLHDLSSSEMLRGLQSGKIDVALLVGPLPAHAADLVFEELSRYPICIAVPRDHRLARHRKVRVRDLAGEPFVAYPRDEYPEYHELLAGILAPTGGAPRVVEEHNGAMSLIAAVEARRGIAVVPSSMACMAGPRLRVIELTPPPPPLIVGAAYDRRRLCPASERFRKVLRAWPRPR